MKKNIIIVVFLFFSVASFSQENNDSLNINPILSRWRFEAGIGYSQGVSPYKDGYYSTLNNKPFGKITLNSFRLGSTYNFTRNIGLKADFSFDRFKNLDTKSKPFEVAHYRGSIQLMVNLTNFFNLENDKSRFHLLFHGGISIGALSTIKTQENETIGSADMVGGAVLGLMPMYRISKKSFIFLDYSSFHNYRQNHTWDGHVSEENNNLSGKMINVSIGITLSMGKKL